LFSFVQTQLSRRALLGAVPALAACPAFAQDETSFLADYERETGGHVGLYAENAISGAKLSWRADERFVMCSSFKASLAALVLMKVDHGTDRLDDIIKYGPADFVDDWWAPVAKANLAKGELSVAEMCEAAVEQSDNTCANLLLARVGGPSAMTLFWREIGDRVTRLDHNEPLLNRSPPGDPHDTTTPRAMAGNFRRLLLGNVLSTESRARLTGWMIDCKTGDNRLRAGLPKAWRAGDKTGNNGKDAAGDIAIVWPTPDTPVLAAAYVQGGSPTPAQIDSVFAGMGRLIGQLG
jgi:beta-lactamase class A